MNCGAKSCNDHAWREIPQTGLRCPHVFAALVNLAREGTDYGATRPERLFVSELDLANMAPRVGWNDAKRNIHNPRAPAQLLLMVLAEAPH